MNCTSIEKYNKQTIRLLSNLILISLALSGCQLTISAGPNGSACRHYDTLNTCLPEYNIDTLEAVGESYIAIADPGYRFDHWEGATGFCAESEGAVCTIVQDDSQGEDLDNVEVGLIAVFTTLWPYAGNYQIEEENDSTYRFFDRITGDFVVDESGHIAWTVHLILYGLSDTSENSNSGTFSTAEGDIQEDGSFTLYAYGWDTSRGQEDVTEIRGYINDNDELFIDEVGIGFAAIWLPIGPWTGQLITE